MRRRHVYKTLTTEAMVPRYRAIMNWKRILSVCGIVLLTIVAAKSVAFVWFKANHAGPQQEEVGRCGVWLTPRFRLRERCAKPVDGSVQLAAQ